MDPAEDLALDRKAHPPGAVAAGVSLCDEGVGGGKTKA